MGWQCGMRTYRPIDVRNLERQPNLGKQPSPGEYHVPIVAGPRFQPTFHNSQ